MGRMKTMKKIERMANPLAVRVCKKFRNGIVE